MRLAYMIILLMVIQMTIVVFDGTTTDSFSLVSEIEGEETSDSSYASALWAFLVRPQNWTASEFLGVFTAFVTIGTGIVIGLMYTQRLEINILFPLFLIILSIGTIPIASLTTVIYREAPTYGCTVGSPCYVADLLVAFICGTLGILWVFTCVEWWSGRAMT